MNRWIGKTAVVTGAGSGNGAAITIDLLKAGVNVVGLDLQKECVERLRDKIPPNSEYGTLFALKCDVTQESDITSAFNWVESELGGTDILVNNAGIYKNMNLLDKDNTKAIRDCIDTNTIGVVLCSREAFHSMKERNVNGHIIHINSIVGHNVHYHIRNSPSFNIYPCTKFAITAMTEVMRQELQHAGTQIKVTSISPGGVKTKFFEAICPGIEDANIPLLDPEDVAQAVLYVLSTKPHVQVHDLIIKPVGEMC